MQDENRIIQKWIFNNNNIENKWKKSLKALNWKRSSVNLYGTNPSCTPDGKIHEKSSERYLYLTPLCKIAYTVFFPQRFINEIRVVWIDWEPFYNLLKFRHCCTELKVKSSLLYCLILIFGVMVNGTTASRAPDLTSLV